MKKKSLLVVLGVCILVGCRATGRLYPVRGPLTAQTPTPVFLAKVTGAFNSGNMSVVLGDGELCKGRWEVVPRPQVSTAATQLANGMPEAWDTVYGSGFYVAHWAKGFTFSPCSREIVGPS